MFFWIDLNRRLTGVFRTLILPFFDHQVMALFRRYEAAVSASKARGNSSGN